MTRSCTHKNSTDSNSGRNETKIFAIPVNYATDYGAHTVTGQYIY